MMKSLLPALLLFAAIPCYGQNPPLATVPNGAPAAAAPAVGAPAADAAGPFQPKLIAPGGIILTLYPPTSPLLKADRLHEAEKYNTSGGGNGPITNVINIHNQSIEVHLATDRSRNGAAVIVAPGGGHQILW